MRERSGGLQVQWPPPWRSSQCSQYSASARAVSASSGSGS